MSRAGDNRLTALLVVAALAAGCGAQGPAAPPPSTSDSPTTAVPVASTTSPPTSESTPPPPTPPTFAPVELPTNDPKACADGECVLRIKRNMTINVGADRPVFRVTKIGKGGVDFFLSYPNGKRATLNLDEVGAYAPFGEFKITLSEWDGNAVAQVEVATK